ncbi:Vacuolar morphogenesis protein 6, variant 3, partial [Basidiobolus ranarum]
MLLKSDLLIIIQNGFLGDRLYIGTSTGVLLVYEVRESTDEEPLSVTLIESKKNFSKKTIEQLEYIKEMDVLVSLSDNVVSMYDTQTLTLRPQLPKIKNAYLFAVSSSIEIEDGIPAIMTRLCVAVKKKLVIYSWEDMDLLDTKEFNVPDKVRKITWASSTKLCLSFTKGYVILDLSTGKLTELFVNAGEGTGLGSSLSELGSMAIGAMGMILNAGKPLIVRLPNDELLVEKDNVSIFISPDGTPTRKAGISWSAAPEELGYSFPYAIAILSKHVEIRNIGTQRLVQNIELMHAQMMTQGKVIYIASADHVWRLIPLDFMKQIDQLVESNEFEEALSLLDQI